MGLMLNYIFDYLDLGKQFLCLIKSGGGPVTMSHFLARWSLTWPTKALGAKVVHQVQGMDLDLSAAQFVGRLNRSCAIRTTSTARLVGNSGPIVDHS